VLTPEFYVFPVGVVEAAPRSVKWEKILVNDIPNR
jgi:hypothetical protein